MGGASPVGQLGQTPAQAGVAPLLAVVGGHVGHHVLVPHQDQELPGPGDGGVEHPPGQEHGRPLAHRQDHRPVLAALGLVHRNGVGGLQLPRVYISSSETLYDVGQLYKNIRSSITGSYPLASLLLPDWSLGSYISQAQLASLLGVDTTATSLQDMTEFELPQKKLQRVQPENAKDGYLYFQLDTGDASANAPVLVIGLEKSRFFADAIPVHILLTIPEHGVSIQLTGTVSAQTVVLTAPTSRMKDEDIQTLVQIRDTIQSVLQFVQTAANSVQNAG